VACWNEHVRHILFLPLAILLWATPCVAQNARPAAVSTVGPWESVMWVRGGKVERCTLSRAKPLDDGTSFGFLIDREVLFGINNAKWSFPVNARLQPMLTPSAGSAVKVVAQAVAASRANITMPRALLDVLQKSDHLDVEVGGNTVRLPFDDFNAARVVLEICVQKIGQSYRAN
jgi:hypothetical protein